MCTFEHTVFMSKWSSRLTWRMHEVVWRDYHHWHGWLADWVCPRSTDLTQLMQDIQLTSLTAHISTTFNYWRLDNVRLLKLSTSDVIYSVPVIFLVIVSVFVCLTCCTSDGSVCQCGDCQTDMACRHECDIFFRWLTSHYSIISCWPRGFASYVWTLGI